jgi:uncharacterized protein
MLLFDLQSLHAAAATVDGVLRPDDAVWDSADARPADGVRVTGRLSATGGGQYYFSGRMAGRAAAQCRRCLIDTEVDVAEELHLVFAEVGAAGEDDPDVYSIEDRAREIDLRPAVREQWLLAVPAYVLCRDDCKGLCPSCGADLNAGPCECRQSSTDPRWAALERLKSNP